MGIALAPDESIKPMRHGTETGDTRICVLLALWAVTLCQVIAYCMNTKRHFDYMKFARTAPIDSIYKHGECELQMITDTGLTKNMSTRLLTICLF